MVVHAPEERVINEALPVVASGVTESSFSQALYLAGVIIIYMYTIEPAVYSCVSLYLILATLNYLSPQIFFMTADGFFPLYHTRNLSNKMEAPSYVDYAPTVLGGLLLRTALPPRVVSPVRGGGLPVWVSSSLAASFS